MAGSSAERRIGTPLPSALTTKYSPSSSALGNGFASLFFIGGLFVYYLLLPVAWQFFSSFEQLAGENVLAITLEPKVNEYLSLVMRLIFAFGISFELPVALLILVRVGFATPEGLKKKRRYAIVVAFVAAAILTPPDPLSQLALAIPIILLYELSILIAARMMRGREAADAAEA